jgi:hypothetical protein
MALSIQKNSTAKRCQQYDANKSVRRKESGVQAAEIAGVNESMLVNKQRRRCNHAYESDWSEFGYNKEPYKREKCSGVQRSRDPECTRNSEARWNRSQTFVTIEVVVLARVEHVKTRGPKQYHERQQQRHGAANLAAHGNPCARRSD